MQIFKNKNNNFFFYTHCYICAHKTYANCAAYLNGNKTGVGELTIKPGRIALKPIKTKLINPTELMHEKQKHFIFSVGLKKYLIQFTAHKRRAH